MAITKGLTTVKDILADIKTITSKDKYHSGTHVLLAKTKAGKFAGSIVWVTTTDKGLIGVKRVGTDVYNHHSLNFLLFLRKEEIDVVDRYLDQFISDMRDPEFAKAVLAGSVPDRIGFIPMLIRATNLVYQDLVKYFREFFAGLPEDLDLVWEYAYEPPLDKPLNPLSKNNLPEEEESNASDQKTGEKYVGLKQMKLYVMAATAPTSEQLDNQTPTDGEIQRLVSDCCKYTCCSLGAFKNSRVYFVKSLEGLLLLEEELKRTDLVKSERRDMTHWFDYPELRGKTIRLNNFDFVIVLNSAATKEKKYGVVSHEALHVVLSLCKQIGYNPLNEQEPATYALEYLVDKAMDFYGY